MSKLWLRLALLDGCNGRLFTNAQFAKRIANCRPLMSSQVKRGAALAAFDGIVIYEARDCMESFLAAFTARDRKLNYPGQFAADRAHDSNPLGSDADRRERSSSYAMRIVSPTTKRKQIGDPGTI